MIWQLGTLKNQANKYISKNGNITGSSRSIALHKFLLSWIYSVSFLATIIPSSNEFHRSPLFYQLYWMTPGPIVLGEREGGRGRERERRYTPWSYHLSIAFFKAKLFLMYFLFLKRKVATFPNSFDFLAFFLAQLSPFLNEWKELCTIGLYNSLDLKGKCVHGHLFK